VSCLEPLLKKYAERATAGLAPRLQGLFGAVARGYLPQAWVLRVDDEAFTIHVDREGVCTVRPGTAEAPDVTIRVGHDRLRSALAGEPRAPGDATPYAVTFQSSKGATAYRFLRDRFGLE
jgi:hypothetical protein